MRVNEVLKRVSKKEIVTIVIHDFCICAYKKDLINDSAFIKRRLGDCIVTHLGICRTSGGFGIAIDCSTNEDYEVTKNDN